MSYRNQIYTECCLTGLPKLPEKVVHTCVTSVPYWGLRDYGDEVVSTFADGWTGQLGLEPTPKQFVEHMVEVFQQVKRVLRDDGTVWLNIGDCHATQKSTNGIKPKDLIGQPWKVAFALQADGWYLRSDIIWSKPNPMPESCKDRPTKAHEYIFLLTKSAKYYYDYMAIKTESKYAPEQYKWPDWATGDTPHDAISYSKDGTGRTNKKKGKQKENGKQDEMTKAGQQITGANKRSVWEVATKPYSDAHFATFPPKLIVDPIKAGAPESCCATCGAPFMPQYNQELVPTKKAAKNQVIDERDQMADANDQGSNRQKDGHKQGHIYQSTKTGYQKTCDCQPVDSLLPGLVLDPFMGSGTTAEVAHKLGRDYVGFDLAYEDIRNRRLSKAEGLFGQKHKA